MTWVSSGLTAEHDVDEFDCGVDPLNRWLIQSAWQAHKRDTARTYVWTQRGDSRVMAYFAITPTQVNREEDGISKTVAARLDRVPAFLIAKLAVEKSIQGDGNGKQLLLDAIGRIVGVAQLGGGRLIVVDAIDDAAASFYEKYDFIPVQNTPRRLIMKIETARKVFRIDMPSSE
ncbi:GNAT family N-acetyltransferase [Rhodococcus spelaei]|uniref:GNAT family N-acetyltransferase n=1 Tax=Rhodococcus spelaei TaxID=2546320 RepID=A0A541BRD6_9NOCA|nr:GNAT family N-acetyltransferase [Rhodococcus spelaei]TQF74865.1 GNAT family N-acetyltransferase [Rhodococcus spelaei]